MGASFALTGTLKLRATEQERRDIGGSLSDTLEFFPDTSPWVKLLNVLGPWAGVIDGVAESIIGRAVYIAQVRSGRAPSPIGTTTSTSTPAGNGRAYVTEEDEIVAPDPGVV